MNETANSPWACDHCGRALDPAHPWVYLAGARFCSLGCVPQTARLRLGLPSAHPPLWRPPPLTPEQEAAIQAWREVGKHGRTWCILDLHGLGTTRTSVQAAAALLEAFGGDDD